MASSPSSESHPPFPTSPQQLGTPENKDFPAPAGWQKKIASTKSGGTPRRGAVYFIAPDGEEIKSKRSLEGYLKSHPGCPSVTEFDWSTGETPRRSSRLSTKTHLDFPESGSGRKRVRRKVAMEDESPRDEERVGLEGAPSTKADEVMEDVEKVKECETVEVVKAVEKMESDINEKIVEKTDEHKILECVSEVETEMAQTVERLSGAENGQGKEADAVLPRENGPEEELVKHEEFGGEKVQTEEGEAEKLQSMMEETPVVEVSEVVQSHGEVTNNGKIDTFEEGHKQEDSEKATNGLSQLSEAPEASRPIGVSV